VPVVAVTESQSVDASGQLTDVYEITVTLEGRPGSFTVTVPKAGDPVAAARAAIAELEGEVGGIYGL
jgi:hypothetical protein